LLPVDTSVQAEYLDGYVLDETEYDDVNPFGEGNVFRAILDRTPEEEHGPMVRFSVFWDDQRFDIAWSELPDNARPIRFRHGYSTITAWGDAPIESGFSGVDFGYQYNDDTGRNVQEVINLGHKK
jgi:hypothetical protein